MQFSIFKMQMNKDIHEREFDLSPQLKFWHKGKVEMIHFYKNTG